MNSQLVIADGARTELRQIFHWYRETARSEDVALNWLNGFHLAIESLQTNPEMFGFVRENDHFPFELRELLYGSGRRKTHRAVFRIVGDRVEVLAIRHLAQRDLERDDLI